MTHYRLVYLLAVGSAFVVLSAACGGSESTSTDPPTVGIEVRVDGIGAVDLGQPPESVFTELNSFFGEPDVDSGWIPPDSALYGTCPGMAMRAAGWGSLYLFFVSDSGDISPESENTAGRLFAYSYGYDFSRNEGATDPRDLNLTTVDGVRLGSTRDELRTLYGSALEETYNDAADTWTWFATIGSGELRGFFSGPEDEARVVLIESSPGCEIT